MVDGWLIPNRSRKRSRIRIRPAKVSCEREPETANIGQPIGARELSVIGADLTSYAFAIIGNADILPQIQSGCPH